MKKIFEWFENRIDPYPEDDIQYPNKNLFSFIWASIDGLKGWILLLIFFNIGMGIFEALLFDIMGKIISWLSQYSPTELFVEKSGSFAWITVLLIVSPFWLWILNSIRFQTLQGVFPMRMRWNFHRIMLKQSLSFYQDEFAGRVSAKVMQTALAMRDAVMTTCDMMVYVGVYFLSAGVILFSFNAWLIIPFLSWAIIFAFTLRWFIPHLAKTASEQADARSLMTGRITDAYSNITTVKLFSHGKRETDYAKSAMQEFMVTVNNQMRLVTLLQICNHVLNIALVASTAGIGIYLWMHGQLSIGVIAAATAMALRVNGLSHWIMWEFASLFENVGVIKDGMTTLTKSPTIVDQPQAQHLNIHKGEINFEHVSFQYNANNSLLSDFNLHIRAGEKIGVIGRSGAGKSTLTNLLLRFYDVDAGRITIDGEDLRDITQDSLRQQIGLVTQDNSLLHRSIRENIMYGHPSASEEAMYQASKDAAVHHFIDQLHDTQQRRAYDAHVGERGLKLSGGQRQRIAIARVMLKDAPILILDEATSALDSEVENAIQENLTKLMKDKTVIAIAHRLSTIAAMDRLIVMDEGRIVEQGSHQELLALDGLYAKLWHHQSGGFLSDED